MPPLPTTPGHWLATYRYRGLTGGERLSPEHLAGLLGVSGATVRRWESNRIRPTLEDLRRFSSVLGLTALESEFLRRAVGAVDQENAPTDRDFAALISDSSLQALPGYVMDSLFYLRGWNNYLLALSGRRTNERPNRNAIAALFDPDRRRRLDRTMPDPYTPWMRTFWLNTAHLCGTPRYMRLIEELRGVGDFEQRWWDLALSHTLADAPVNLPQIYHSPQYGVFRILTVSTTLPPNFYLRLFVPVDGGAHEFLDKLRAAEPPRVDCTEANHWSLD